MPAWLVLSAFLQIGALNGAAYIYSPPYELVQTPPCYAELGGKAAASVLYIDGAVRTLMQPTSITSWYPEQMTYKIGAGLDFGWLKIGWEHECYHPIAPYTMQFDHQLWPKTEGATDDFFIRFEIKK